jgi:hypothetical protein
MTFPYETRATIRNALADRAEHAAKQQVEAARLGLDGIVAYWRSLIVAVLDAARDLDAVFPFSYAEACVNTTLAEVEGYREANLS